MRPEHVAIVGSREGIEPGSVGAYVLGLPKETVIVSGGAKGVDSWAQRYAEDRGMQVVVIPADWDTWGRRAGFIRNIDIVDRADRVVAFWNGESKGTKNTIDQALKQRKPLEVYFPSPVEFPLGSSPRRAGEATAELAQEGS